MSFATTLDAALWLASHGIPCFPCLENKRPACPLGYKAATADKTVLSGLWSNHPGPLIGVPTGLLTGFDILDVDPQNEGDKWFSSIAAHMPQTQTHCTRSGGYHILFKHKEGIRNSAGKIAKGIDVRGDGGYVIWWPLFGLNVFNHNMLAEWPDWLLAKLITQPRNPSVTSVPYNGYAQAALQNAAQSVATAPSGTRNCPAPICMSSFELVALR